MTFNLAEWLLLAVLLLGCWLVARAVARRW